ncbi:MAG: GumC family protein [Verrucomicrobiota bacterium]
MTSSPNSFQPPGAVAAGGAPAGSPAPFRPSAAATGAGRSGGRVEVARFFQPYLERVWLILLLTALGTGGAVFYALKLTHVFAATATIQAQPRAQKVMSIQGVGEVDLFDEAMVNTLVQNVKNSAVLLRVVRTNRLAEGLPAGKPDGPSPDERVARELARDIAVRLRPRARLIDVTVESTNAATAARLANSLVREFLAHQSALQSQAATWGSETLFEEARTLEDKVRQDERKLQQFREKHRLVSVAENQQALTDLLTKFNGELIQGQGERLALERDLAAVAGAGQDINRLLEVPAVAADPSVQAARQHYQGLDQAFSVATNRYKPAHPKYLQAYLQLTNTFGSLQRSARAAAKSLEQRVAGARASEARLQKRIDELQAGVQQVTALAAEYGDLQRQLEMDSTLLQSVLKRVKELELSKDLVGIPLTLVEPAVAPTIPVRPNKKALAIRGLLGGLVLALILVYFLQQSDASLRTVDETEERLGLPVLGAVGLDKQSSKGSRRIVMVDEPQGLAAEGFRSLRANVGLLGRQETLKVHLLTSAIPSEGKTFCSVNYSSTLAQLGQKVVLVDLDLRRPAVGNTLGLPTTTPGVTTYLVGQGRLDELLLPTRVEGLQVLVAGPLVPNPAEQLAGPHLAECSPSCASASTWWWWIPPRSTR